MWVAPLIPTARVGAWPQRSYQQTIQVTPRAVRARAARNGLAAVGVHGSHRTLVPSAWQVSKVTRKNGTPMIFGTTRRRRSTRQQAPESSLPNSVSVFAISRVALAFTPCPPLVLTFVTTPRSLRRRQCHPVVPAATPAPTKGNRAMKPKDRMFPTIDEHYQLQLQPVVAESYPQRRWNRSGADRNVALHAGVVDPTGDRVCKSTTTRH